MNDDLTALREAERRVFDELDRYKDARRILKAALLEIDPLAGAEAHEIIGTAIRKAEQALKECSNE